MTAKDNRNYSLDSHGGGRMPAPALDYQPRDPERYRPNIGLIACGGIAWHHLNAYRKAGYRVAALCDLVRERAEQRREEFFPRAEVYEDYSQMLRRDDIEVVDIATHPAERVEIIEDTLNAGKHVLSQKPFVLDLDVGRRLVDLADRKGLRLAVNQNGRWAPQFSYIRQAISTGLLGDVCAAHLSVHWDHSWVQGTPFEQIRHLILYDFAIHWFDIVTCFMAGRTAHRVYASTARAAGQPIDPPLLAQAVIEYDGAQASLAFDAFTRHGSQDRTYISGTQGTITSLGPSQKQQKVTLTTADGHASPRLVGRWFSDGFHGTMGELLRAIEENREPSHSARNNLHGLALCFAAAASADEHRPFKPGEVRRMPD